MPARRVVVFRPSVVLKERVNETISDDQDAE